MDERSKVINGIQRGWPTQDYCVSALRVSMVDVGGPFKTYGETYDKFIRLMAQRLELYRDQSREARTEVETYPGFR